MMKPIEEVCGAGKGRLRVILEVAVKRRLVAEDVGSLQELLELFGDGSRLGAIGVDGEGGVAALLVAFA